MMALATVTVIGRDKTGVIARITSFLFEQRANIEGLEEQVTRGQFSMTLQASWKGHQLETKAVSAGLARRGTELGMEIKIRFTEPTRRQRMAIMVTREPHCLEGLVQALKPGKCEDTPFFRSANRSGFEPSARSNSRRYPVTSALPGK